MVADRIPSMTAAQYLEWEARQSLRHEFMGGRVIAMTGASMAHNTIASNLVGELHTALRTSSCRAFGSDMRVQVSAEGPFFYPDLSVSCDEREATSGYNLLYPCLIVEILSPSTEAFDRGAKSRHYRQMATLQEYVLIDSQEIAVECLRRGSEGGQLWTLQTYGPTASVRFESIGLEIPVAFLYEKVQFPPSDPHNGRPPAG